MRGRPRPLPSEETLIFWEAARQHRLVLQHCLQCGSWQYYARGMCASCLSDKIVWEESSGRGIVYTYSVVYRPPSPAFVDDVPFVVAIVELEEGVRLMTNIVGCPPEAVAIGMPVAVGFEELAEGGAVPVFRLLTPAVGT